MRFLSPDLQIYKSSSNSVFSIFFRIFAILPIIFIILYNLLQTYSFFFICTDEDLILCIYSTYFVRYVGLSFETLIFIVATLFIYSCIMHVLYISKLFSYMHFYYTKEKWSIFAKLVITRFKFKK